MGGCGEMHFWRFLPQMVGPATLHLLHGAGNALLATRPQREAQAPRVRMACPCHSSHCFSLKCNSQGWQRCGRGWSRGEWNRCLGTD